MTAYDVESIRADFPILAREVNGWPLTYLDNAATSQKPRVVIDALSEFLSQHNANVHRGMHALAMEATGIYEGTRTLVSELIGGDDGGERVVFTKNTTESLNLAAYAWGRSNLEGGDVIVLTEMEHHSNLVPWQVLAKERGLELRYLPIDETGKLDISDLDGIVKDDVGLVAVTHCGNVLGDVNPIRTIADRAHAVGARVVVDGAQAVPHMPVDVMDLGADMYAFSGHKMCGPSVGVLWMTADTLAEMGIFLAGGDMIEVVELTESTYAPGIGRLEAGTQDALGVAGLAAAIGYLQALGFEEIRDHALGLAREGRRRLAELPGISVHGADEGPMVTWTDELVHPHDFSTILDAQGIAIRAGHHCAQPLHRKLGLLATARASFYLYNTSAEVETLVRGVNKAKEVFGGRTIAA